MKLRVLLIACLCVAILAFVGSEVVCEGLKIIPEEPQTFDDLVEITYFISNGILIYHYDLNHDKITDLRVARIPKEELANEFGNFYTYRLRPAYYAVDFNLDGDFADDEIFVDMAESGERDLLSYPQWLKLAAEMERATQDEA